jgi:hypothetical protein
MASYSAQDQAADLGIHRIHSLVLGDAKKEAREAARYTRLAPPHVQRAILGRGDSRHEDWQQESYKNRELARIAKRQNLKRYALR